MPGLALKFVEFFLGTGIGGRGSGVDEGEAEVSAAAGVVVNGDSGPSVAGLLAPAGVGLVLFSASASFAAAGEAGASGWRGPREDPGTEGELSEDGVSHSLPGPSLALRACVEASIRIGSRPG